MFTVNFSDTENVSEIYQSFKGNLIMKGKMAEICCKPRRLLDSDPESDKESTDIEKITKHESICYFESLEL